MWISESALRCREVRHEGHAAAEQHRHDRDLHLVHLAGGEQRGEQLAAAEQPDLPGPSSCRSDSASATGSSRTIVTPCSVPGVSVREKT